MYGLTKEDLSRILPSVRWAMKEGLLKSNKRTIKAYASVHEKYRNYLSSTLRYEDIKVITDKYNEFRSEEYNAFIKYGFNFTDIYNKYTWYKKEIIDNIFEEKRLKEYMESRVEGTPV